VVLWEVPCGTELPWLKTCLFRSLNYDEDRGRGAHSCGAVADFHRIPEHPDDCDGDLGYPSQGNSYGMERFSMTSTFIALLQGEVKARHRILDQIFWERKIW